MTLSEEVGEVLQGALNAAREAGHAQATPAHVALVMMFAEEVSLYLERCGTDLVAVESRLRQQLEDDAADEEEASEDAQPSAAFHALVEAAMLRADEDERECVMLRDLFFAVIEEPEGAAGLAIREATRDPEIFDDLGAYPWEENE